MEPTLKEKIEKIKNFRPIDDVFFEVLAANKAVCQEILSTILEDKGLTVEAVEVQSSIRRMQPFACPRFVVSMHRQVLAAKDNGGLCKQNGPGTSFCPYR